MLPSNHPHRIVKPSGAQLCPAHTGAGIFVGELVGGIVPVPLTPFWVFALFIAFLPSRRPRTLIAATSHPLVGAGITLPAAAAINYAFPGLATCYWAGNSGAMSVTEAN